MIFQNIDFHNVAEMTPVEDGWRMWRVPAEVREKLNENARLNTAAYATGVELRFKLKGESADIHLRTLPSQEAPVAYLYYGSIQGGWQNSSRFIGTERTTLHFERPANMDTLKAVSQQCHLPFDPEVIRIVLPYTSCIFMGVDGEVETPAAEDLPQKTCLCYGSSITHGSLALAMPYTYPFRIAQKLSCDYINMGFAGTAHLEKEMAEYIVSRKDWDFATFEMGINMLGEFTEEQFDERVREFTDVLEKDGRPVFLTSVFGFNGGGQEKAQHFRESVRKYAQGRFPFMDGLDMVNNPAMLAQDEVHPSLEGIGQIAQRWVELIEKELK